VGFEGAEGVRLGAGVLWRPRWKFFILSAMAGFMPDIEEALGTLGGRRAALRLPSGCDEAVMLDTVDEEAMLDCGRGAVGDGMGSSGERGGDGELRGDCCSSGEDMVGRSHGQAGSGAGARIGAVVGGCACARVRVCGGGCVCLPDAA
jgi:hypothetical protein